MNEYSKDIEDFCLKSKQSLALLEVFNAMKGVSVLDSNITYIQIYRMMFKEPINGEIFGPNLLNIPFSISEAFLWLTSSRERREHMVVLSSKSSDAGPTVSATP